MSEPRKNKTRFIEVGEVPPDVELAKDLLARDLIAKDDLRLSGPLRARVEEIVIAYLNNPIRDPAPKDEAKFPPPPKAPNMTIR